MLTLLLVCLTLCSLCERKVVPPRFEAGLGGRGAVVVSVVDGRGGHESVRTGSWGSRTLWAGGVGLDDVGTSRGRDVVYGDGVRTGALCAVAVFSSPAVAATMAKWLEVLPHPLLSHCVSCYA